ncbi:MAG: trypsin-like peptidase domain-containing protein [Eubacteriales bacterium]|nr:trypsin-like peptidase domain-containing protein [Eubacteriales bacterium]
MTDYENNGFNYGESGQSDEARPTAGNEFYHVTSSTSGIPTDPDYDERLTRTVEMPKMTANKEEKTEAASYVSSGADTYVNTGSDIEAEATQFSDQPAAGASDQPTTETSGQPSAGPSEPNFVILSDTESSAESSPAPEENVEADTVSEAVSDFSTGTDTASETAYHESAYQQSENTDNYYTAKDGTVYRESAYGNQDYSGQTYGSQNYSSQNYDNQNYGGSSYGDQSFGNQGYSAGQYDTGSSYGSADPGYSGYSESGAQGSGFAGGSSGGGGGNYTGNYAAAAGPKKNGFSITKKAFILSLILCVILSSFISIGGMLFYTNHINGGTNGSATNYKLVKSDETLSYSSIIDKTEDSVVSITTQSVTTDNWAQNYVTEGAGSGVIIQSDGYIITCQHVIDGATKINVTLNNKKTYSAKIVGQDEDHDIAVLKINAKNLTAATYGDSSKLSVGDQVVVIGNPLGQLGGTATTGIISALNRNLTIDNKMMNLLQTDASINPGNSGGGMFDASGNLIGIVEAKSTGSDVEGLGFATPINKAASIAKSLIKSGGTGKDPAKVNGNGSSNSGSDSRDSGNSQTPRSKVQIGINVTTISDSLAKEYGYSTGGVYVSSITNHDAAEAGLKEGDIIYKADGQKVTTADELITLLNKKSAGDKVKLSVARQSGNNATVTVTLHAAEN